MLDLFKNHQLEERAYSLIELIVALAIFMIVVVVTSATFTSLLKAQRKSYNLQLTQDTARYVIEMMAKEARMAKVNSITTFGSSCIFNMKRLDADDVIEYTFFNDAAGNIGKVQRNNQTQSMIRIVNDSNKVEIKGCVYGQNVLGTKRVTIVLEAKSKNTRPGEEAVVRLQTSLTPRYYGP